jgi:hypothetical protein
MSEGDARAWVWISDEESRAAGRVSVLAVVETLICVAVYWVLLLRWGVTWHHWVILLAAPLVLMRSDASVARGVRWFDAYFRNQEKYPLQTEEGKLAALVAFVSAVGVFFLSEHILLRNGIDGFWPFDRVIISSLLALTVATSVSVAIVQMGAIIAVLGMVVAATLQAVRHDGLFPFLIWLLGVTAYAIACGIPLGIWLRAVATRVLATALHIPAGLAALPNNWRAIAWKADVAQRPDLVPGHAATAYGQPISRSFRVLYGDLSTWEWVILGIPFAIVFYAPTLLWRWAIKSTAWFYLPLLWVGRGWQNLRGRVLTEWAMAYATTVINWVGVGIALACLAGSTLALLMPEEFLRLSAHLEAAGAPMSPLGYLMVLDLSALATQPWQWFYLPSWLLTVAMFFVLDSHAKHVKVGADAGALHGTFRFWMWVGNIRVVLTNVGLAVALVYFLRAVNAWEQVRGLWERVT